MKKILLYINSSIKRRLIFYLSLCFAIFIISSNMLSYFLSINTLRSQAIQSTEQNLTAVLVEMDETFEEAVFLAESLVENATFQSRLREHYSTVEEMYSVALDGDMELANLIGDKDDIYTIYILSQNDIAFKSTLNSFGTLNYKQANWYQTIISQDKPLWFSPQDGSIITDTTSGRYIMMGMPYQDKATGINNGVLIVEIAEEAVLSSPESGNFQDRYVLVLDEYNRQIMPSSSDTSNISFPILQDISNDPDNFSFDNGESRRTIQTSYAHIVMLQSSITGWKLLGITPNSEMYGILEYMPLILILLTIITVVICARVLTILSRKITHPINDLQDKMKSVEDGDLSVRMPIHGADELAQLASGFNHMTLQINELMNLVYEKQKLIRDTEFKALQSQINPHFLYNSLDSIVWLLKLKQYDDAQSMLQNLITLFRITLSKGKELIPISNELDSIRSYLAIQQIRYSNKFDYEFIIDEGVYDYITIKTILQPLVENAIYHAISPQKSKINIKIIVAEEKDNITFCIQDNGCGINAEKLQLLKSRFSEISYAPMQSVDISKDPGGYGLQNVNDRIKLYFGEKFGLFVESEEGVGTTMTIKTGKKLIIDFEKG